MPKPILTEKDFQDAARQLNCEVAAIKAVAEVESKGDGFLPTGEPKILFERHIFLNAPMVFLTRLTRAFLTR
ncbi:N-acetylmuramidase family protein [Niabella hibiscisoli]|uniref:N-acetylmuramidase family protein n=1 Tax=Niabella hibiscisoli TaxID=1825928 RepID=UPI0021D44490|nr:N-acetylmuramidase family protein [Niabella hibiscisoli]